MKRKENQQQPFQRTTGAAAEQQSNKGAAAEQSGRAALARGCADQIDQYPKWIQTPARLAAISGAIRLPNKVSFPVSGKNREKTVAAAIFIAAIISSNLIIVSSFYAYCAFIGIFVRFLIQDQF